MGKWIRHTKILGLPILGKHLLYQPYTIFIEPSESLDKPFRDPIIFEMFYGRLPGQFGNSAVGVVGDVMRKYEAQRIVAIKLYHALGLWPGKPSSRWEKTRNKANKQIKS